MIPPKNGALLQLDFEAILFLLKSIFQTEGAIVFDAEHGSIIQLQGDIRKEVSEFLSDSTAIVNKDQIRVHETHGHPGKYKKPIANQRI